MNLFFFKFKNIKFKNAFTSSPLTRLHRDDIIFGGALALSFFFLTLLLADSYIFYQTVINKKELAPEIRKTPTLTSADIDDAIKLLDDRQKKFNEILGR